MNDPLAFLMNDPEFAKCTNMSLRMDYRVRDALLKGIISIPAYIGLFFWWIQKNVAVRFPGLLAYIVWIIIPIDVFKSEDVAKS